MSTRPRKSATYAEEEYRPFGKPLPNKLVGLRRQPHGPYQVPNGKELDDDLHGPRVRNINDPMNPTKSRTEALLDSM
jgi:hypothetical protein